MSELRNKGLYFIAILPTQEISEKVERFKLDLKSKYGVSHALKSPAHITLIPPFKADKNELAEIESVLYTFASSQNPFMIHLNGYGCFKPRVIFIKVEDNERLEGIYQEFKIKYGNTGPWKNTLRSKLHPHMTLATRDVKPLVFYRIWDVYKYMEYKADFVAHEITLLKHTGKNWEVYQSFTLSP